MIKKVASVSVSEKYKCEVDFSRTFGEIICSAGLGGDDHPVDPLLYYWEKSGKEEKCFRLVWFGEEVFPTTEEVRNHFLQNNLRLAEPCELVHFAEKYPGAQNNFAIIGMGLESIRDRPEVPDSLLVKLVRKLVCLMGKEGWLSTDHRYTYTTPKFLCLYSTNSGARVLEVRHHFKWSDKCHFLGVEI